MKKFWYFLKVIKTHFKEDKAGWTIVAIALLLSLTVFQCKAKAAEYHGPMPGDIAPVNQNVIGCDTKEEIADIVVAGEKSGDEMLAKFQEYNALINLKGEHTCVYSPLTIVGFLEHIALPDFHALDGEVYEGWAVHFGNAKGDWWFLFAQKAPPTL